MRERTYTLLALGDSYTIGEAVPAEDSFPAQAVRLLKEQGFDFSAPLIIAKTGWTTDELMEGIEKENLAVGFDFVTLLIGVNNQYRGRNLHEYRNQFQDLLKVALQFATEKASRVVVLSIPDWGVTPYAAGRDQEKIASEISLFNAANKDIAAQHYVHYLDITPGTREAAQDHSLLADDQLHPSGKEYGRWAARLAVMIGNIIKNAG